MGWGHVKVLIGAKSCGIFENISSLRTFEKKKQVLFIFRTYYESHKYRL